MAARDKVGAGAPEVLCAPACFDHPLFIKVMAERVEEALGRVAAERRAAARLVFTAHSVPAAMANGSPYEAQLEAVARVIAGRLSHPAWTVAYQSRSGSARDARARHPRHDPRVRRGGREGGSGGPHRLRL